MNHDSPLPAPQFFASGSNIDIEKLKDHEDGVGPKNYVVFSTMVDALGGLVIANLVWMPLFFYNLSSHGWNLHGLSYAVAFNSVAFGVQASLVTR